MAKSVYILEPEEYRNMQAVGHARSMLINAIRNVRDDIDDGTIEDMDDVKAALDLILT